MYQCQWISSISTGLLRLHGVSFVLLPLIHYLSTLKGKLFSLEVHKIFAPSQMLPMLKKHSVLQYESNTLKHILPQVCIHTCYIKSCRQTPCTFDTWFGHNTPNSTRSVYAGHIFNESKTASRYRSILCNFCGLVAVFYWSCSTNVMSAC